MQMTASQLQERWRDVMRRRMISARHSGPRHAALGFLSRDPPRSGFVPLRQLTIVVAHDVVVPGRLTPKLRLAGYSARVSKAGIQWGGVQGHRFEKNLALTPQPRARGPRLDLLQPELVTLGLRLTRRLEHFAKHPNFPQRTAPVLPRVWAGLIDDGKIRTCDLGLKEMNVSAGDALPCRVGGLLLVPVAWIDEGSRRDVVEYFAELRFASCLQSIVLQDGQQEGLVGTTADGPFDFCSSKFGRSHSDNRCPSNTAIGRRCRRFTPELIAS